MGKSRWRAACHGDGTLAAAAPWASQAAWSSACISSWPLEVTALSQHVRCAEARAWSCARVMPPACSALPSQSIRIACIATCRAQFATLTSISARSPACRHRRPPSPTSTSPAPSPPRSAPLCGRPAPRADPRGAAGAVHALWGGAGLPHRAAKGVRRRRVFQRRRHAARHLPPRFWPRGAAPQGRGGPAQVHLSIQRLQVARRRAALRPGAAGLCAAPGPGARRRGRRRGEAGTVCLTPARWRSRCAMSALMRRGVGALCSSAQQLMGPGPCWAAPAGLR